MDNSKTSHAMQTRKLKLDSDPIYVILSLALLEINQLGAVSMARFIVKKRLLKIAYDPLGRSLDDVLLILEKHGLKLSHSRWQNFKLGYYQFVDQNIRDNAKHKPVCCNKPQIGSNR